MGALSNDYSAEDSNVVPDSYQNKEVNHTARNYVLQQCYFILIALFSLLIF